jgi:hypothetical protein
MRNLTVDEKNILAHVVVDPNEWWEHCQANFKGDPEAALSAKTAKHKPDYDNKKPQEGYKTRAEKDTESKLTNTAARGYKESRERVYRHKSDPLFFEWQLAEAMADITSPTKKQTWIDEVAAIKIKYPK